MAFVRFHVRDLAIKALDVSPDPTVTFQVPKDALTSMERLYD